MSEDREKKERVLHTRIPESLESEIKRRAGGLGMSVSNLVRNVLANAFGMIDDIVSDSADVARRARDVAAPLSSAQTAGAVPVLGWQRLVLERNALCERCNAILPRATEAFVSVIEGPGARAFRCAPCVEEEMAHESPR